jgi:hypothetical protein
MFSIPVRILSANADDYPMLSLNRKSIQPRLRCFALSGRFLNWKCSYSTKQTLSHFLFAKGTIDYDLMVLKQINQACSEVCTFLDCIFRMDFLRHEADFPNPINLFETLLSRGEMYQTRLGLHFK